MSAGLNFAVGDVWEINLQVMTPEGRPQQIAQRFTVVGVQEWGVMVTHTFDGSGPFAFSYVALNMARRASALSDKPEVVPTPLHLAAQADS